MPLSQPKARRRGGPRSKGGCGRCKARHIKCDETKPHCRRCSEAGKTCDGYSTTDLNDQAASMLISTPITAYAIPFRIPGSQQDRRLLHYYCVQGADDLCGHLGSEFWMRLVLQHSHDYIPVRQAVVALSCAHQYYVTAHDHDSSNLLPAEAMVHYSKAMRSLRKYMSAGIDNKKEISIVVPLVCSVLFFCFENAQGSIEGAIRHLNSGIGILARQKEGGQFVPESRNHEHIDLLEQMLVRFDLQASMFDGARRPLSQMGLGGVELEDPASDTFATLDNAQADLAALQSRVLQFLLSNQQFKLYPEHDLPEKLKLGKQVIEEAFTKWHEKLNRFSRDRSVSPEEHGDHRSWSGSAESSDGEEGYSTQVREGAQDPAITILRIHYDVFQLLLAGNFPYNPSIFDGPSNSVGVQRMSQVLDLIESTPQVQGAGSRSLGIETGVIAPLFMIVMKCTDLAIINRAFGLLSALSGRREGMFDSRLLADIASRVISQYRLSHEWQAGNARDERVDESNGAAKKLDVISTKAPLPSHEEDSNSPSDETLKERLVPVPTPPTERFDKALPPALGVNRISFKSNPQRKFSPIPCPVADRIVVGSDMNAVGYKMKCL